MIYQSRARQLGAPLDFGAGIVGQADPLPFIALPAPREVGWPPPAPLEPFSALPGGETGWPIPGGDSRPYIALPLPWDDVIVQAGGGDAGREVGWPPPEPPVFDAEAGRGSGETPRPYIALPLPWEDVGLQTIEPAAPRVGLGPVGPAAPGETPGPLGVPWAGWIVAAGAALKFLL